MSETIEVSFKPPVLDTVVSLEIAREIRELAAQQAQQQIQAARARTAEVLRAVKARVKKHAYASGQKMAKREAQAQFLDQQKYYNQTVRAANQDCLALTLSVAEEVLSGQVKLDQTALATRIQNALTSLLDLRNIKVLVHKKFVKQVQKELSQHFPDTDISVEANNEIEPGNAIVETISGSIELNWHEHFNLIKDKLFANLEAEISETNLEAPHA